MKIVLIMAVVLAVLFVISQVYAMSAQKGIEEYPYEVVKTYDAFEIRDYQAALFTSVTMPSTGYSTDSSKGFRILAGYIFGGNSENESISMTSPVAMTLDDSMTMMFMVPKKYTAESLPKPNQSDIKFKEIPAKRVASITFGGWANDEKINAYKIKLIAALDAEGIAFTNRFFFLGYNSPMEVINRKNEVIVELK